MASKNAKTAKSSKSSKSTKTAKTARTARESRLAPLGYKSRDEMLSKARAITLDDGMKIKVMVKENPKRGKSGKRFSAYKTGMKVAAALEKGLSRQDIKWDAAHKYIALSKH